MKIPISIFVFSLTIYSFSQNLYMNNEYFANMKAKKSFKSWFKDFSKEYNFSKVKSYGKLESIYNDDIDCPCIISPKEYRKSKRYERDAFEIKVKRECDMFYFLDVVVINSENKHIYLSLAFTFDLNLISIFELSDSPYKPGRDLYFVTEEHY